MEIPNSYPNQLSSEEIMKIISDCTDISVKATKKNSNYSLGPSYYVSMAELGQIELNRRIQTGLLEVIEKQRLDNKKAGYINWGLSLVTIVLAITTLYIGSKSLGFAESDEKSDEKWQINQLELLKKNNDELMKITELIGKISETDTIQKK